MLDVNHTVRILSHRLLIVTVLIGAVSLVAVLIKAPPRSVPADERIPDRIVIRQHSKLGGGELATLTNREDILQVMTALPSSYPGAYCACFGFYDLEFYDPTGVYRTVSYKPGEYLRDSEHRTGQSSVPRRFRRIVGGMIAQRELRNADPGQQDSVANGSQTIRAKANPASAVAAPIADLIVLQDGQ